MMYRHVPFSLVGRLVESIDARIGDLQLRNGVRPCQLHLQYFANLFFETPQIAYFIVLLY